MQSFETINAGDHTRARLDMQERSYTDRTATILTTPLSPSLAPLCTPPSPPLRSKPQMSLCSLVLWVSIDFANLEQLRLALIPRDVPPFKAPPAKNTPVFVPDAAKAPGLVLKEAPQGPPKKKTTTDDADA